jgi:tetratricopeptide (TPR) repeat protein
MKVLHNLISALLLLIFFQNGLVAQNIDSLKALIVQYDADTNKVKVQLQLFELLKREDITSSQKYVEDALELSNQLNYTSGIAESQFALAQVFRRLNQPKIALQYYSDAQKSFIKLGEKDKIASIYNDVGVIYKNQGLYKRSREYYEQALKIYQEIDDNQGVSDIYSNIGVVYSILLIACKDLDSYK